MMKILVLQAKKCVKYLFVSAAAIMVFAILSIAISHQDIFSVFSSKRDLPIYSVDCPEKIAAITFDCAWGADDIPEILETMRNEDVKATFFIVGQWAGKFPNMVKMISDEGHDIANHSYSHLRMDVLDNKTINCEINECAKKLNSISDKKIDLFRAPYGGYNDNIVNIARKLGLYTIQWDVDSLDWRPEISKEEILRRVMQKVKPGSIILFHNDTSYTAELLPTIITSLKKEGYGFLPVSRLILRENYVIDYDGRQKKKE